MNTDGAKVAVEGPYDVWSVMVTPSLHGLSAPDLGASVSVGPKGVVQFASGMIGSPEGVGDVDYIDTAEAIDRLNEGASGYGVGLPATRHIDPGERLGAGERRRHLRAAGGRQRDLLGQWIRAGPADDPVPCTTASTVICPPDGVILEGPTTSAYLAPDTPVASGDASSPAAGAAPTCGSVPIPTDPPEPIEIVLTDAHVTLMLLPASDGSNDGYLVPGYEFSSDDGGTVAQVAIAEDALAPVDPTPDPTATTGRNAPR